MLTGALLALFSGTSVAAEEAAAVAKEVSIGAGLGFIAAAAATAIACVGAGFAVANVGSAAMGLVGEKPEMLGTTLIYLGLAEGIAIYGVIVSLLIIQKTPEETHDAIREALKIRDLAILAITEKAAEMAEDAVRQLRERGELPLVVEIPDRFGTKRGPDFLTKYVQEAIGVKM